MSLPQTTTITVTQDWRQRAREKRLQTQKSIPKEWILNNLPDKNQLDVSDFPRTCGLLSTKEIEITESHFEVILSNLAKGLWSAVEVTTAFSKRAIVAHQVVNCLTEIFIDKALARAAALDDYFKRTGKVVGPFHGLPISLKDQVNIKGIDSTIGYISWIGKPATKNAVIADILESLGAVLYVKTNVPQTLIWAETFNLIFGRTLNPLNRSLTCGGSSGGEGALVAMKGSPLGIGSDAGGSIRIPAGFHGLYTIRPSSHRIPYRGCVNTLNGQISVPSVLGPVTRSLEGVKAFMKNILSSEPWQYDPLMIRKKWSEDEYRLVEHGSGKQLCFGIIWDDGFVKPHPPVQRGMKTTKEALIRAGHKVIDWVPFNHREIYKIIPEIFHIAAYDDFASVTSLSGEPIIGTMLPIVEEDPYAPPERSLLHGPPDVPSTAAECWQANVKHQALKEAVFDYWRDTVNVTGTGRPVDAIIAPLGAFVAPPHGMNRNPVYTVIWNILDYAATVIPVSKVDPILDPKQHRDSFYSDMDREIWETYDPATFENAPISVQIVARTNEEEALIGMSEIVDKALKAQDQGKL